MIDTSDQSTATPVYTTALYEAFKASRKSARLSLLSHLKFKTCRIAELFPNLVPDLVPDPVPALVHIYFQIYLPTSFPISLPSDSMRLKTGSPSSERATSAVKPSEFTDAPAPSGT